MRLLLAACIIVFSMPATAQIVSHPSGCPWRAFCGCGVSVRLYGHPVKDLYRAAAYSRFPRSSPASGMVAYRSHHVFYIERVIDRETVLAYDPNSGGHQTRIHEVSLRGYHVVDPNGNPASRNSRSHRKTIRTAGQGGAGPLMAAQDRLSAAN